MAARRPWALASLVVLLVLFVAAIVVGGGRPALAQGVAPTVLRLLGAGTAVVGGLVLLGGAAWREGAAMVVAALALGLLTVTGDDGLDIGGGFLVLACLAVLGAVGVWLARAVADERRR